MREDPLWENSRVLRSWRMWSAQTCLWTMMILHIKNYYCKDMENELKSYHNKTNWANLVRMQDSWLLLKSDSISWRKTLKNSHNSQIQWPVVSTLCQETKIHLNRRPWIRGNTKIGLVLEFTTCCLQGEYGVEIRIMSVSEDYSHSWVRISHRLNKFVTDLNNNEQETSEMQFEEYALRLNAGDFASRSKTKAKPQKRNFASSSTKEPYLWGRELGLMSNQENNRYEIIQCRRNWSIFFVMEAYLETMMERLNSGE